MWKNKKTKKTKNKKQKQKQKQTNKLFQGPELLHQSTNGFENFGIGPSNDADNLHVTNFCYKQRFLSYLQKKTTKKLSPMFYLN